jgi:hypothetical protein
MHVHLPRKTLAVIGAAALMLGIGGAAGAAITAGPVSGGVIYGCYTTTSTGGSHALVLQDKGTSCPSGDTAIKWNRTGPVGPPGPVGPSTAGPSGLNVITVESGSPTQTQKLSVAACPADHPYLVGGGGSAGPGDPGGGLIMTTDSPMYDLVEVPGANGAAAGATTVDVGGNASPAFAAGMTVTFEPGTANSETDTLTSVADTGVSSGYYGTIYQWTLATPLVNSHANGSMVQGPGWEVTTNGTSVAWAFCSR